MKFSLIKMVFRRYRKIVLSLVMIAALAVALINGMFNAWESLDLSLKRYIAEYGIADAVISTEIVHADTKERIMETGGVAYAAARLTGSSRIIAPSGQTLTAQIISMDKEDLLKVYHWEDTGHTAGDYVLADRWFAEHNGFSAGDVLRIRTGEDEYRALRPFPCWRAKRKGRGSAGRTNGRKRNRNIWRRNRSCAKAGRKGRRRCGRHGMSWKSRRAPLRKNGRSCRSRSAS